MCQQVPTVWHPALFNTGWVAYFYLHLANSFEVEEHRPNFYHISHQFVSRHSGLHRNLMPGSITPNPRGR